MASEGTVHQEAEAMRPAPAPFSIWRRMAAAEARQVELDLNEAAAAGTPYPDSPEYNYQGYLDATRLELDRARLAATTTWPPGWRRVGHVFDELVQVWTGSQHETAVAALHRAEGLLLMVLPDANVRSEALKMWSIFNDTKDIPLSDPRYAVFTALFKRIEAAGSAPASDPPPPAPDPPPPAPPPAPAPPPPPPAPHQAPPAPPPTTAAPPPRPAPPPPPAPDPTWPAPDPTWPAPDPMPRESCRTAIADRVMLRELRRVQHESWEIALSRLRIFRNILSGIIPFLALVLIGVALLCSRYPKLITLRPKPGSSDVAMVVFLGAFGGLLSAVASVRALRNFQRFYGLPLAQSILKLPAGAATALGGTILLQHGVLGIAAVDWEMVIPYALAFGIAQIAVTRRIDSRASDLLGDANNKSPSTAQTASASIPSNDIS